MEIGEVFFWTATINNWNHLLKEERFKEIIINSLRTLSGRGIIDVFSFVIMPNHIHLIWRTNQLNGKETAQGSFLKFTAHEFKKMLRRNPNSVVSVRTFPGDVSAMAMWAGRSTRRIMECQIVSIGNFPT